MALKAVANSGGGGLIGSLGAMSIQLSNAAGAVVNGTYYLAQVAPFDMTLYEMLATCDSGSFAVVVQIDGVTVTGSSQTISGVTDVNLTANNVVINPAQIKLVVTSSTGNPPNAAVQILFTRDSL